MALRRTPEDNASTLEYRWRKLIEVLGDMDCVDVTPGHLVDYVKKRSLAGASIDEIRREMGRLHTGMKLAKAHKYIRELPEPWPEIHGETPPDPKRKGKYRAPELLRRFLSLLPQDAQDEVIVIALTGLRKSEAKRLTWNWVQLLPEGHACPAAIELPAAETKTRRARPLLACPQRALDILRRRNKGDGKRLLPQASFQKQYERATRKLGLEHNITRRDLRTTFATTVLRGGIDAVAARDQLGHTTIETTNIYLDVDPLHTVLAAAEVERALFGQVGTVKPAHLAKALPPANLAEGILDSEAEGRAFESPIARHIFSLFRGLAASQNRSNPLIAPHARHSAGTAVRSLQSLADIQTIADFAMAGDGASVVGGLADWLGAESTEERSENDADPEVERDAVVHLARKTALAQLAELVETAS